MALIPRQSPPAPSLPGSSVVGGSRAFPGLLLFLLFSLILECEFEMVSCSTACCRQV